MLGGISVRDKSKIYDRMAADLPINSQVAPDVVQDQAGDYIKVLRTIRDDPLFGMFSRKQIDAAQFEAGRLWQQYREDSEIGGAKAIDTTKEAVDGGRFKEPDIERLSTALKRLKEADDALGAYGASLVYDVLGRRMSINEKCLESMAKLWGFA
jgi:hypothetical protein